jgi:hypothetical protein
VGVLLLGVEVTLDAVVYEGDEASRNDDTGCLLDMQGVSCTYRVRLTRKHQ